MMTLKKLVTINTRNGFDDLDLTFKMDNTSTIKLTCSLMSYPTNVWYCDDDNDVPQEVIFELF